MSSNTITRWSAGAEQYEHIGASLVWELLCLAFTCPGAGAQGPSPWSGGTPVTFVPECRDQRPWRRLRCRGNGEIVIEEVVITATMMSPPPPGRIATASPRGFWCPRSGAR